MSSLRALGLWLLAVCVLFPVGASAQIEALPRPDSLEAASFGVSVAIGDSIAVVGASGTFTCGDNAGAVFVYERRPGPLVTSWRLSARLAPRNCQAQTFFGADVALSGSRVLVSAFNSDLAGEGENAAYVFERTSQDDWVQTARFTGFSDRRDGLFAAGVALDGNRAAVSTSGNPEGAYHGAVYVFRYDPTTKDWAQTAWLTAHQGTESGVLGHDVALEGNALAVSASTFFAEKPGSVYLFRYESTSGRWHRADHVMGIDAFFIGLDLHNSTLIVGEDRAGTDESGRATIYTRADTTWTKSTTLRPSVPYDSGAFGAAVSLQGRRALITGYDEQLGKEINIDRVVYVFRRRANDSWDERTILDIGTVDFGAGIDQNDQTAIISSVSENESGTAYVTRLP